MLLCLAGGKFAEALAAFRKALITLALAVAENQEEEQQVKHQACSLSVPDVPLLVVSLQWRPSSCQSLLVVVKIHVSPSRSVVFSFIVVS